jgi:hypothetical protein
MQHECALTPKHKCANNQKMREVRRPKKVFIMGVVIMMSMIALAYSTAHSAADYSGAAGALCLLWTVLFDRLPIGAKTIGDVYRSSRQGWRMSKSAKVMSLLGIFFVCISFYMKFH